MLYEAQFAETIPMRGHKGDLPDAIDGWKRVFAWFDKYLH